MAPLVAEFKVMITAIDEMTPVVEEVSRQLGELARAVEKLVIRLGLKPLDWHERIIWWFMRHATKGSPRAAYRLIRELRQCAPPALYEI